MKLERSLVGPTLAARIRGSQAPGVCALRELVAGTATTEDLLNAIEFVTEEIRKECFEDWGAPDEQGRWIASRTPRLAMTSELILLRGNLNLMATEKAAVSPFDNMIEYDLPAMLCPAGKQFMPFQNIGIRFATSRKHTLIADEPGLGKTCEAVGVINTLEKLKRIVIVTPASLRINWTRELNDWLILPYTIAVSRADELPDTEIIVIGYSTVDRHVSAFLQRGIDLLILDECHAIKSATSTRTKACSELIKSAKRGVYLSGTPMLNRPIELEPLLKAVDSPIAENFQRRYCDAKMKDVYIPGGKGKKRKVWDTSGAINTEELGNRLRESFMIRRLKSDVLKELPLKRRRILALDNGKKIPEDTNAMLSEIDLEAYVSGSKTPPQPASEIAVQRHKEAIMKIGPAAEYIEELLAEGLNKIVVFAHHRDALEMLLSILSHHNPVILYGGMNDTEKQRSVDTFQTDPRCLVFVGSIQAAGVGITLTAATRAIMIEWSWVPAENTQAEDRIHRKGQLEPVMIEYLVLPGGIDDRIAKALIKKQNVIDIVMNEG